MQGLALISEHILNDTKQTHLLIIFTPDSHYLFQKKSSIYALIPEEMLYFAIRLISLLNSKIKYGY